MYGYANGFGRTCFGPLFSWNVGGIPAGGIFMWILFIALAGAVVYFLVRRKDFVPGGPGAEETLKKRFARGEISREEYREILKDLRE